MGNRKKLIEVILPLSAINTATAREMASHHGHHSALHLWWNRRSLAVSRAVLFSSLVDDPGNELPPEEAREERDRLFSLIKEITKLDNSNNDELFSKVFDEIKKSTNGVVPTILDPFAGGGSIPLSAQRLGLEVFASDLNPVAVLINKALVELPVKSRGFKRDNPNTLSEKSTKIAVAKNSLADDVREYGHWMHEEAGRRIGYLYPKGPKGETIIGWLWARTVKCPNLVCGAQAPLVRSFWLSTQKGKRAWVEPAIDYEAKIVRFEVSHSPGSPEGTINRLGAKCLICGKPIPLAHIESEGQSKRMGIKLMAMIAEGKSGPIYLNPENNHEIIASSVQANWKPDEPITPEGPYVSRLPQYGLITWGDVFKPRQLIALTTLSGLIREVREQLLASSGGNEVYSDSVATYLALAVDRLAEISCNLARWDSTNDKVIGAFSRRSLAMLWNFVEVNPFAKSGRNFLDIVQSVAEAIEKLPSNSVSGTVEQLDATTVLPSVTNAVISTDPPYYDKISYADLSDFFYVWLRHNLGDIYTDLFSRELTPKIPELIEASYRFKAEKTTAEGMYEENLIRVFARLRRVMSRDFPSTIFLTLKQNKKSDVNETGAAKLEVFLEGLINSGFQITATWPMYTERSLGINSGKNNLPAPSIALVYRQRSPNAATVTGKEFIQELQNELPALVDLLLSSTSVVQPIPQADFIQAAVGLGLGIYSRYSQVVDDYGEPMRIFEALRLIRRYIDGKDR